MKKLEFNDIKEMVLDYAKKKVEEIKKDRKKWKDIEVGVITTTNLPDRLNKVSQVVIKDNGRVVFSITFNNDFSREHTKTLDDFIQNLERFVDNKCIIYFYGDLLKINGNESYAIYKHKFGLFKIYPQSMILLQKWFPTYDYRFKTDVYLIDEKEAVIELL